MHALMEKAQRSVDQAELYWNRTQTTQVLYQNARLQQVVENDLSAVALRVIENGRLGSSCGVSPDREELLHDARTAAGYGDPASFSFAPQATYPAVRTDDERVETLSSRDLIDLCEGVKQRIGEQLPDIALTLRAHVEREQLTVATTAGAHGELRRSEVGILYGAPFRGVGIGLMKGERSVSPLEPDPALVDEFIEWYRWGETTSTPSTGRLPVLLAPEAAYLVLLPLLMGVSGDHISKGTSPLIDRVGSRILSDKLTILDEPLTDGEPNARPFDDEGMPCGARTLVEDGVLADYITDLRTGAALGRPSTGHGFKSALFGGGVETAPTPWFAHPVIRSGDAGWRELAAGMDEGLLITNGMGFHSGNYPQGQFAVQAVGFHVVSGEVVGRLDKTMISGNIYEDFRHIRAVSREQRRGLAGLLPQATAPFILVDGLQVAGA